MTELLTAAQMRAIEEAAMETGEVTGLELMERAGKGVVEAVFEEWPDLAKAPHRAVVLCGPGNNGGDGYVVARLLKEWGWDVEVFLLGDSAKLPPDAKRNHARWDGSTQSVESFQAGGATDLMIDACFGTGLTRPVEEGPVSRCLGAFAEATHARRAWDAGVKMAGKPARTVAVDIPSGLCADSGQVLGQVPGIDPFALGGDQTGMYRRCAQALLTVTFHRPKRGHFLSMGQEYCGRVVVKRIGLDDKRRALTKARMTALLPLRDSGLGPAGTGRAKVRLAGPSAARQILYKYPEAHKYDHGHALVLCGPTGRTGAARLAARGALRIGAGLVTVGSPPEAIAENAAHLTAIMLRDVTDGSALKEVLQDQRWTALCLGPGLGTDDRTGALLEICLSSGLPTVLDADALTCLAAREDLRARLRPNCVLTPHAGEFARLFPDLAEKLRDRPDTGPAYSKVDACQEAAARTNATVLFKGPDTVIAAPDGQCVISSAQYKRTAPWLATAGAGDVLAGFITGLLARRFDPLDAAEAAAWIHVECARSFGPGLIAEDLPEELPKVLRGLGV